MSDIIGWYDYIIEWSDYMIAWYGYIFGPGGRILPNLWLLLDNQIPLDNHLTTTYYATLSIKIKISDNHILCHIKHKKQNFYYPSTDCTATATMVNHSWTPCVIVIVARDTHKINTWFILTDLQFGKQLQFSRPLERIFIEIEHGNCNRRCEVGWYPTWRGI